MKYLIAEVAGKQVKIYPNKPFEVELQTELKEIPSKVLLSVNGKVEIGKPYLRDTIKIGRAEV